MISHPNPVSWVSVLKAGISYVAIIFSIAFLMGIFRVAVLARAIGDVNAVLIELSLILAISWFSSSYLARKLEIASLSQRLAMGGLAVALVLFGEASLSLFWLGKDLMEFLGGFQRVNAILGLIGQVGFALIPATQLLLGQRSRS